MLIDPIQFRVKVKTIFQWQSRCIFAPFGAGNVPQLGWHLRPHTATDREDAH